jgi:hypothetical protein
MQNKTGINSDWNYWEMAVTNTTLKRNRLNTISTDVLPVLFNMETILEDLY